MNKKFVIEIFLIVLISFLLLLFIIAPFLPIQKWIMVNQYKKDKFDLERIAIDLLSIESNHIYISKDYTSIDKSHPNSIQSKAFLYDNNYILKNRVNSLLQQKEYLYIEKFEECVFFCKKASLGRGIGISYTVKNKNPKSNSGDMMFKQISGNWFYCELD